MHIYLPFPWQNEAQVQANLAKLNVALKRAEADFLNAKYRFDTAQAAVNAEVETLEAVRTSAQEATEHLQQKSAEVNALRSTLAVDEREREVKLTQLKGVGARSPSFWS
jgi:predicted flap endonuclease-1-like 5' DNA nuclease